VGERSGGGQRVTKKATIKDRMAESFRIMKPEGEEGRSRTKGGIKSDDQAPNLGLGTGKPASLSEQKEGKSKEGPRKRRTTKPQTMSSDLLGVHGGGKTERLLLHRCSRAAGGGRNDKEGRANCWRKGEKAQAIPQP